MNNPYEVTLMFWKGSPKENFANGAFKPVYCTMVIIPSKSDFLDLLQRTLYKHYACIEEAVWDEREVWRACGHARLSREEWAVVEDFHEHIIDRWEFESVQWLLGRDTRTNMSGKAVGILWGLAFCGECGAPWCGR